MGQQRGMRGPVFCFGAMSMSKGSVGSGLGAVGFEANFSTDAIMFL